MKISVFALLAAVFGTASAETTHDIIIVGSGLGGLGAGRRILDKDPTKKVVVLEAMDRVGGRLYTSPDLIGKKNGCSDIGASWIHKSQVGKHPIKILAQRMGATNIVTDENNYRYFQNTGGVEYSDTDTAAANAKWQSMLKGVFAKGKTLTVDQSIEQVLRDNYNQDMRPPLIQSVAVDGLEFQYGASMKLLSAKRGDSDAEFSGPEEVWRDGYDSLAYALKDGTLHTEASITTNGPALDVKLGDKVVSVVKDLATGEITVTTKAGVKYVAKKVVVNASLGVLKNTNKEGGITFSPALNAAKMTSIEKLGFGNVVKMFLRFPTKFWEDKLMFFVRSPADPTDPFDGPIDKTHRGMFREFVNTAAVSGEPTLITFAIGGAADVAESGAGFNCAVDSAPCVAAAVESLQAIYPSVTIPAPTKVLISKWRTEDTVRGAYTFIGIGASFDDIKNVAAADWDNSLHFVGEHTSTERYIGSAHGAYLSGVRVGDDVLRQVRPPVPADCPMGTTDPCCAIMEQLNAGTASSDQTCNNNLILPARVDFDKATPREWAPFTDATLATMCDATAGSVGCIAGTRSKIAATLKDARDKKAMAGCRTLKAFDDVLKGYCTKEGSSFCYPKMQDSYKALDPILGTTKQQPTTAICADKCHAKNYALYASALPIIALSHAQERAILNTKNWVMASAAELRAAVDVGTDGVKDGLGIITALANNVAGLADSMCMTDSRNAFCWPKLQQGAEDLFTALATDTEAACADECTKKAAAVLAANHQSLANQMNELLQERISMINPSNTAKAQMLLAVLQPKYTAPAAPTTTGAPAQSLQAQVSALTVPEKFKPVFDKLASSAYGAVALAHQVVRLNMKADVMDALASRGCGKNANNAVCVTLAKDKIPSNLFVYAAQPSSTPSSSIDFSSMMPGSFSAPLTVAPTSAFDPPKITAATFLGSAAAALPVGSSLKDGMTAVCADLSTALKTTDGCCTDMVTRVKNAQLQADANLNVAVDKMTNVMKFVAEQITNANAALTAANSANMEAAMRTSITAGNVDALFAGSGAAPTLNLAPSAQSAHFKGVSEIVNAAVSNPIGVCKVETDAKCSNGAAQSVTKTTQSLDNVDCEKVKQNRQLIGAMLESITTSYASALSVSPADVGVSICGIDLASISLAEFKSASKATAGFNFFRRLAATTSPAAVKIAVPAKSATGVQTKTASKDAISLALADNAESLGKIAKDPTAVTKVADEEAVEDTADLVETAGGEPSADELAANAVVEDVDDEEENDDGAEDGGDDGGSKPADGAPVVSGALGVAGVGVCTVGVLALVQ